MMNAEIAIRMYKLVQTGAKSWFGGVKDGLARFTYQSSIAGAVKKDPAKPAPRHITTQITSLIVFIV
jgi:hypothetical protein